MPNPAIIIEIGLPPLHINPGHTGELQGTVDVCPKVVQDHWL